MDIILFILLKNLQGSGIGRELTILTKYLLYAYH